MPALPPESETQDSQRVRRHRRRSPGVWAWLIAMAWAALAVIAKWTNFVQDHAITNILFVVFLGNVGLTFLIWFFWFSHHPREHRRLVGLPLAAALLIAAAILRPVRTTGDLMLSFRFVWQSSHETPPLMEVGPASGQVDLLTATAHDFPQYLGPHRDMKLSGPVLATNWADAPPEQLWRQDIGAGWSGFVTVGDYAVTLEQRDGQELVTCYRRETGELAWSHGIEARHETLMGGLGPRSTPTIFEGRVYALGATGVLRCLDSDGNLLWSIDIPQSMGVESGEGSEVAWGRANSPLIVDDLVVLPAGGPAGSARSLVAYDRLTGDQLWVGGDDQISYSSPVVYELAGTQQIVCVNEASVSGHRIKDGEVLWEVAWPGSSAGPANTSQPMKIDDSTLLLSKGYNRGAAELKLSESDGEWRAEFGWQSGRVLKTKLTSTVVHEGFGYGLNDGVLQCVDLSDGALKWKAGRLRHGQPLLVGGLLLAMTEWGDLQLYHARPSGGPRVQPLAVMEDAVQGTAWNTLCLSGDLLLVRTNEEAACYRLPTIQHDAGE